MWNIFRFGVFAFWLMDAINMPFMEIFDTRYPLNFLFWLIVWIVIPGYSFHAKIKHDNEN